MTVTLKPLGVHMRDFAGGRPELNIRPFGHFPSDVIAQAETAPASVVLPETAGDASLRGRSNPRGLYARLGKRVLDVCVVILSIPFAVPLILFCAVALWLEGGKPFYRQPRLGQGGKVFSILKLRTMVQDADAVLERYLMADPEVRAEWDEMQKLKNDPRITRLGRLLRSTSLDELPQLWNVFVGEMSLVGPRPMMPDQLPLYGRPDAYFAQRPGITGLWQVSARNGNTFAFRNEIDANYDRDVVLRRDLGLLFKTVSVVLRRTGY